MTWFTEARLGMFVHWSHCSQAGRELSWPLVGGIPLLPYSDPVPVPEYHATAATFAPRPGSAAGGPTSLGRRAWATRS